jgi:hypothetical protein
VIIANIQLTCRSKQDILYLNMLKNSAIDTFGAR